MKKGKMPSVTIVIKKYTTTHRCRSHHLLLLGTNDDEVEITSDEPDDSCPEKDIPGDISSLNALMGHPYARALHLEGSVGPHQFHMLMDSGITHNFVKLAIIE